MMEREVQRRPGRSGTPAVVTRIVQTICTRAPAAAAAEIAAVVAGLTRAGAAPCIVFPPDHSLAISRASFDPDLSDNSQREKTRAGEHPRRKVLTLFWQQRRCENTGYEHARIVSNNLNEKRGTVGA